MADEPATPATPAPEPTAEEPKSATGDDLGDAGKQALDRMKAERNEAQKAAKKAQNDLEQLRKAQMGEAEKAVAEAEERGRAAALAAFGNRLVDAEFRAIATGRTLTPEALLTFDRAAFIADDGEVKRDDLTKWVEANSTAVGNPRPSGDADFGARQHNAPLTGRAADIAQIEADLAKSRR